MRLLRNFSHRSLLLQNVISADVDEPWPLEIYDRQGNAVNITMEPGDMVLYGKFCRILLIGMNIKCNFFLYMQSHLPFSPFSSTRIRRIPLSTSRPPVSSQGTLLQ